jgi:phospholipid/cholesterol/gamma-HCH transport system substrate-binding protein
VSRTSPALDLDALIGGFKPLFRALDPQKVNTIATALITVFQGQGGTINDILDNTAQLTSQLGQRDQAIGEVIKNLNIVLDTTVRHRQQFDQTVNNLEVLITGLNEHRDQLAGGTAHISNAAGTVADLLAEDRGLLHKTINYLDAVQQPLIDQRDELNDFLHKLPTGLNLVGRAIGSYGDFVNFYACDISLEINGLQGGGPVRTVRLFNQPSGRCTPQ